MRWRMASFSWSPLVLRLTVVLPLLCMALMPMAQAQESASPTAVTAGVGQSADADFKDRTDQTSETPATPSGDYGWQSALPKLGPMVPTANTNGKKRKKEAAVVTE